jgi:hypothetical protein
MILGEQVAGGTVFKKNNSNSCTQNKNAPKPCKNAPKPFKNAACPNFQFPPSTKYNPLIIKHD